MGYYKHFPIVISKLDMSVITLSIYPVSCHRLGRQLCREESFTIRKSADLHTSALFRSKQRTFIRNLIWQFILNNTVVIAPVSPNNFRPEIPKSFFPLGHFFFGFCKPSAASFLPYSQNSLIHAMVRSNHINVRAFQVVHLDHCADI